MIHSACAFAWITSVAAVTAGAQQTPTMHLIDRPVAETRHDLGSLVQAQVRELPNSALLINDPSHRRLLLLDSTLKTETVVSDTSTGRPNSYGTGTGSLLRYFGDSSILVLPRIPAMYVIDPTGKIARVTAVPRPQDAGSLGASTLGTPGFDSKGRLIYRGATPPMRRDSVVPGGPPGTIVSADSVPLVRFDPSSHTLDTVAKVRARGFKGMLLGKASGGTVAVLQLNPLPQLDEWAVTPDGALVILRGQDYHFDVLGADGTISKWPKMAFAWEHLTDEGKTALIDSAKAAMEKPDTTPPRPLTNANGSSASGGSASGGMGRASDADEKLAASVPHIVSPDDLPDYKPPFDQGALRPDADGNLWIRTTQPGKYGAGAVYDVTRQGKVIDRVQLQPGRVISGFGKGGVVYMFASQTGGSWVEKTVWHVPPR